MPQRKRKKTNAAGSIRKITVWLSIIGAALLLLLCGCAYYLWVTTPPKVNIDSSHNPVVGIDISKHNGKIDFAAVAADSIRFAYIKASEGAMYRDPRFDHNVSEAKAAGLKTGAYHFFRHRIDGVAQAENFIKAISDKQLDMPAVIDLEDWGNDLFVDPKDVKMRLKAMIATLKQSGYRVMIYTNGNGHRKYLNDSILSKERLWLCKFTEPGKVPAQYNWDMLQFSHWGAVNGINGDVDLDVFNGTNDEWNAWLNQPNND